MSISHFTLRDGPVYTNQVSWLNDVDSPGALIIDIGAPLAVGYVGAKIFDVPVGQGIAIAFLAIVAAGFLGYSYRVSQWIPKPPPPSYAPVYGGERDNQPTTT